MTFDTRRKRACWYVLTFDVDKQAFTPQKGVRCGPYTLFGTRKALRKLATMGYAGRPSEPMVLVDHRPKDLRRGVQVSMQRGRRCDDRS